MAKYLALDYVCDLICQQVRPNRMTASQHLSYVKIAQLEPGDDYCPTGVCKVFRGEGAKETRRRKRRLQDLASLRLVNKLFCRIAAIYLFQDVSVQLSPNYGSGDEASMSRLMKLSLSENAALVRSLHVLRPAARKEWIRGMPYDDFVELGYNYNFSSVAYRRYSMQVYKPYSYEMLDLLLKSVQRFRNLRRIEICSLFNWYISQFTDSLSVQEFWAAFFLKVRKLPAQIFISCQLPNYINDLLRGLSSNQDAPEPPVLASVSSLELVGALEYVSKMSNFNQQHYNPGEASTRLMRISSIAPNLRFLKICFGRTFDLPPTFLDGLQNLRGLSFNNVGTHLSLFQKMSGLPHLQVLVLRRVGLWSSSGTWRDVFLALEKGTKLLEMSVQMNMSELGTDAEQSRITTALEALKSSVKRRQAIIGTRGSWASDLQEFHLGCGSA